MKVGDFVAHNKCFAIDESKCMVETMSKEQIQNYVNCTEMSAELASDGTLEIPLTKYANEHVYSKNLTPTKLILKLGENFKKPCKICVRVSKSMGSVSSPSSFIGLGSTMQGLYSLKFLNSPDITNYTRLFLEIYCEDYNVFVKVDGC